VALVRGVLFFRLNDAYSARLWEEHRSLKDLNLALHEAQSRWIRVEQARRNVPTNTGEFAERIAALKTRIEALETRLAATEDAQRGYLERVAVNELEDQKSRLATYQIQARFALASMYDRAANAGATPAKAPAAEQKGADQEPPAAESPAQAPAPEAPALEGSAPQTQAPGTPQPQTPQPQTPQPQATPPVTPQPQGAEPPR
jgi:hypothetical protein